MNQRKLIKAEVDLKRYNEGTNAANGGHLPQKYRDGSIGLHLPWDVPMYARVFRLLDETEEGTNAGALRGWTVQLDAFTFDVSLYVRVGLDGTLKVFAKTTEGKPVKLEEWNK